MNKVQLLGEVEDIIRTMPPRDSLTHDSPEVLEWSGRASATMNAIGPFEGSQFFGALSKLAIRSVSNEGTREVQRLLHMARHSLRMATVGPMSAALGAGEVFDYFDEVRKIIETAAVDLFFIDPYIDAEFVSRYLPHAKAGVSVRLLTRKGVEQLTPAAQAYVAQHQAKIAIRTSGAMHDRFVIVDGTAAYQSGASFKDGAKRSPTTLTQITDAFAAVRQQYEDHWAAGQVHM